MKLAIYLLRRLSWSAAGFAVAFTLASYFLIPPADMLWWAFNERLVAERLQIIRHYPRDPIEQEKRLEQANTTIAKCTAEVQALRAQSEAHARRVAELERQMTELERQANTLKIAAARPPASCDVDPAALRAKCVRPRDSLEFFDGRLHLSVTHVYDSHCSYLVGTDKWGVSDRGLSLVGAEYTARTSVGDYRVILRRFANESKDGPFCEFDIIPIR